MLGEAPDGGTMPLDASIQVEGLPLGASALAAAKGAYYRVLAPGTYTVTVSAPGFKPRKESVVIPAAAPGGQGGGLVREWVLEPTVPYPPVKQAPSESAPALAPGATKGEQAVTEADPALGGGGGRAQINGVMAVCHPHTAASKGTACITLAL